MLKRIRKSSGTVTLVLIGVAAAISGCSGQKRDVYASKEDCLADWGNKPEDCSAATDPKHANRGFFYGPLYTGSSYGNTQWSRSTGTYGSRFNSRSSGFSSGSSSSSRGGFGSTSRSSSSSSSS